jgi:hypothetical protein
VRIDATAAMNAIGGTTAGSGNVISGNGGDGVIVSDIGTIGNSILGNSIHDNAGVGINLVNGGNNSQAAPAITSASSSSSGTSISGTLASVANTTFRIEFFSNQAPNASGFGEGLTLLGFVTVTTDTSGNAGFTASLSMTVPLGQRYLSATATNLSTNDTSAFAKDLFLPFNFSGFLPTLNQNMAFALNRTIPDQVPAHRYQWSPYHQPECSDVSPDSARPQRWRVGYTVQSHGCGRHGPVQ